MTMNPLNTGNSGVPAPGISIQEALVQSDLPTEAKTTVLESIDKVNLTIVENFLPTEEEQKLIERQKKEDAEKEQQAEIIQQEQLAAERNSDKPNYI